MKFLTLVLGLSCFAALLQVPEATAQVAVETATAEISIEDFAARNRLSGARLSPDGSKLASRFSQQGNDHVMVFDAATGKPSGSFAVGEGNRLNWVEWAGNHRLLVSASAFDEYNRYWTRLFVADLSSGDLYMIGRKEAISDGDDVIWIAEDGSSVLVSLQANTRHYPSVYRFDLTRDGEREQVQGSRTGVWNWHADRDGIVRIGTGWYRDELRVHYRKGKDAKLDLVATIKREDLEKANETHRYFAVLGIEPGTDIGYVLEENEAGRIGLRRFDFAQSKIVDTVFEHAEFDVDSVEFSREGAPSAVHYTDDTSHAIWLDDDLGRLQRNLEAALEEEQVRIVSRSRDNGRMIVWGGGPADPGALYVYTVANGTLDVLGEMSAGVHFEHLARPKAIDYTARDGTKIRAYLTLPKDRPANDLPLIILPHGGPYGIRDTLEYDPQVQLLANRGYAVLQPNYRGSGGYGDAFFDLGYGEIGRAMQDDLDDAMDWVVEKGIANPARVCIVGASYGGYAAIWGATRNPERYRCAASWAGVMDWDSMLRYDSQFFSRQTTRRWRERYEGKDDRDFRLSDVSPLQQSARLARPILLAHGTDDGVVNVGQYHQMLAAARQRGVPVKDLLIDGEGHGFTEIASAEAWYRALIDFLAEHNPPD